MLELDIYLEGFAMPAGHLVRDDTGTIAFAYDQIYLSIASAIPLSLSLALGDDIYGDGQSRAFFQNLLPENDQLDQLVEREGIDRDDIAAILYHLGSDCAGAVSCLPAGAAPVKMPGNLYTDYDPISLDDLTQAVERLADRQPLEGDLRDPSPVAGVRRKIALAYAPDIGFAMPKPGLGVPTTHILKVPDRRDRNEALFEACAAELAAACGLEVAVPELRQFGDIPGLLIPRFDRLISNDGTVNRLHQEDFAQALSLPPRLKYERRGSLRRRFSVEGIAAILASTSEPGLAVLKFLQATLFNLAIGNSDNHAKNHALLYDCGPVPRLAPLYDMLPILLDSQYTHELAFKIGAATHAKDLTPADLQALLAAFGLEGARARRFIEREVAPMLAALDEAAARMPASLKRFDDLIGGEIERLSSLFELGLKVRERDCFEPEGGGGWLMS